MPLHKKNLSRENILEEDEKMHQNIYNTKLLKAFKTQHFMQFVAENFYLHRYLHRAQSVLFNIILPKGKPCRRPE